MFDLLIKGAAPSPKKITSWFLSKGQGKTRDDTADYIPHDIYVIGTQEDPQGEKEWLETLRQSLQEITSISFKVVRGYSSYCTLLRHMRRVDFVQIRDRISGILSTSPLIPFLLLSLHLDEGE